MSINLVLLVLLPEAYEVCNVKATRSKGDYPGKVRLARLCALREEEEEEEEKGLYLPLETRTGEDVCVSLIGIVNSYAVSKNLREDTAVEDVATKSKHQAARWWR